MRKITGAVIIIGALLAGCASPTAAPTPAPSEAALEPTPAAVPTAPAPTETPTACATATSTPAATPTPQPTNTPTAVAAYTLSGTVFFDYNGNGLADDGEPPIEGVPIRVAGLSTTSGPDGSYSLAELPAGSQQVYVESPTQEPATAFRYISLSLEAFQPIDDPIALTVAGNASLDIALMQGFLTPPYKCITANSLGSWYDLAPMEGAVRNWNGDSTMIQAPAYDSGTLDQHDGIDYLAAKGTQIVASAPGVVDFTGQTQPIGGYGPAFVIEVVDNGGYVTHYGHIDRWLVSEGQRVRRGEPIAETGSTGSAMVHLHWSVRPSSARVSHNPIVHPHKSDNFDPYRDLSDRATMTYWTVDNNPQCLP